jgi:hypothetical protein
MDTFSLLAFIFALLAFIASVKNSKLIENNFSDLKDMIKNS